MQAEDHSDQITFAKKVACLRSRAEERIRALAEDSSGARAPTGKSMELVVDGYAQVLALDVNSLRLRRELSRLAEAGDPAHAADLRELSALLRILTATAEQLRHALGAARARAERDRREDGPGAHASEPSASGGGRHERMRSPQVR